MFFNKLLCVSNQDELIKAKNRRATLGTSLAEAIKNKKYDLVPKLLALGALVSCSHGDPLGLAIIQQNEGMVKLLLPYIQKDDIGLILPKAIATKNSKIIQLLLEPGNNHLIPRLLELKITDSSSCKDLFVLAIEQQNEEIIKFFLSYIKKDDISLALPKAIEMKNSKIVKLLLERGADPFRDYGYDKHDLTAFPTAFRIGDDAIIFIIMGTIKKPLEINWKNEEIIKKSLEEAIRNQKYNWIPRLINLFAFQDTHPYDFSSSLNLAASQGDEEIVKLLLPHVNEYYITSALYSAVEAKNLKMVKFLLGKGASPFISLTKAVQIENDEIISILMDEVTKIIHNSNIPFH